MCSTCALAQRCNLGVCTSIGQSGGPGGGSGGGFGGGGGTTGGGTGGGTTGGGTGGGTTGGGTGGGATGGGGGTAACSSANCTGCCAGGVCVPLSSNNNSVCGAGGTTCVNCTSTGKTCNLSSHTCEGPPPDAGSGCTGCLSGTTCVPYSTSSQSATTCGGGAAACRSCSGLMCEAGNCTSLAVTGVVGNTRVRLVGGNGIDNGRLEVFANGGWGQVCDDVIQNDTTNGAAKVVCRDLGFTTAANNGTVSQVTMSGVGDFFLLDETTCTGSETQLLQCGHDPFGVEDCSSTEAVFIDCAP